MNILHIPRKVGQALIVMYQRTLSFDHGPLSRFTKYQMCKYHPTCSEYGYQAVGKYGLIKGSWMTGWRILRCNPWSKGGEDPVQ
ncbi:membrane protein insertion efficiency factor YidD [Patescibacteria group bacterium]|nr:membrane protein insertion efficiency factor YidD [Patescibacteria group bacterium]